MEKLKMDLEQLTTHFRGGSGFDLQYRQSVSEWPKLWRATAHGGDKCHNRSQPGSDKLIAYGHTAQDAVEELLKLRQAEHDALMARLQLRT